MNLLTGIGCGLGVLGVVLDVIGREREIEGEVEKRMAERESENEEDEEES